MKTALFWTVLFGWILISCNNEAKVTIEEDSVENKVKRAKYEVDSTAKSLKDSAKREWKEIKDRVEDSIEDKNTNSN